jgi:chromosome partitioning protein
MYVIAPITKKGGAGKSTTIAHLATALAASGEHPLIIDCDTSIGSLHIWGRVARAGQPAPTIVKADAETLDERLDEARIQGRKWVFVDVPAGGGDLVSRIASLADLVLIPVKSSSFDIAATKQTIDTLKRTTDDTLPVELAHRTAFAKAAIVLVAVPPRPTKTWEKDMDDALIGCGAKGIDVIGRLSDRAAFRTSLNQGQGVTEVGRDANAIQEVEDLLSEIRKRADARAAAIERIRVIA